ncbi:MAG TPA: hydroxyacid dehydrogenase [Candidatus Atribacteria bacterium]|nr:hydroxyacid dehydrogenase [Candidatus Atribacteria bacterium]
MNGKKRPKIAIVNSSSFGIANPEHLRRLQKIGDVERFTLSPDIDGKKLGEILADFNVIVASVQPNYNEAFFDKVKNLLLITRHGIGINNIDIEKATEKGVLITKVVGIIEQESMAEHTVTLMLAVARRLVPAYDAVKRGEWSKRVKFIGYEIKGKRVGIVGIGNIGSRVAEILKNGFSAEVVAYDPGLSDSEIREKGAEPIGFEELISTSDIITLHAPLLPDTYHMIGTREFSLMKKDAILIDTARGELIDTDALIDALKSNKLFGVGLDVVEGEPIEADHPLLEFENVIIGPHIGAYTKECLGGMGEKVVSDVERLFSGKKPEEMVNPEAYEGIKERLNEFGIGS